MQRDNHRRGFSIYVSLSLFHPWNCILTPISFSTSHQKVVLEIDFSGALWGYTEITVIPTSKDLKTIHLNSRQCTIHSATVASYPADFVQYDPFTNITVSNAQDLHNHPELKRRVYSAYAEGEEGELSIALPKEVHLRQHVGSRAGSVVSESTPEPGATHTQNLSHEFAPITIHIEYSLRNPMDGVQFVLPSDAYPYRVPHAFTTPSAPDAARCWVPCIDSMWEKCTWEFEFVVPRYLEERDAEGGEEFDEHQGEYSSVVVCSGELVEQVAHPYNSSKTIFLFSQPIATSVQQVAWAAGPFHVYPVPAEHFDDTSGSQPLMHAFCLPGHETQLASSVAFIRSAMNFFLTDLGSYPYGSHKLVFVDELPMQRFDSATLSLCTVDLLHGEDAIDQVYETRLSLSHALACQWVGINIHPKTNSDLWLTNGLGLYVTGMFLRKILGQNEYRYRMKKDMERVYESDNGQMPPICQPQVLDPPDSVVLAFITVKAPLVLHILDRRLCKSGTSLGLSRVLPKIFLSAISGELINNALSTHAFLRMCRKVSGMDPRSFAEQWIYGSGCPSFNFTASFNRKKMAVEILMRQESPAYKANENSEMAKALLKPVPFFEGQMTIRIHEADGTPYEHVLDIRTPFKRFEVPFNTKYKRVRRNTKRYMARQAAAQAAAEGSMEGIPETGTVPGPGELVDVGFGVDIWDSDQERENWKIAEWTEEDEAQMSGATYEWIRLDADFEWITSISFEQPIFMWVSQLQRDRDVVAQIEAVRALGRQPTAIVSSILTKTILTTKYFYRIRSDAAVTLAKCAVPRLDYLGLFHLFKLFLRYCYDPEDQHQDLFTHTYVPRSNDFSDLAEYFVRKALLNGLSRVRFDTGKTPAIIRQFLIDQLRFNDNTSNPYSDAYYICTIVSALGAASVPAKPPERNELVTTEIKVDHSPEDARLLQQAMAEVDRYRSMDRLIPSYHNVVTIAAIDFYLLLSLADLVPNDPRLYFPLTREGNYIQVRMAAFDALFLTKWYTPKIMRYFLAVMSNDPSRTIRRHVARNACQSLALLFTMGELKASSKDNEALLIEEDGSVPPEKAKEQKKSELDLMIKALRKDREVGKNEAIREFLMPVALAPDVDYEVRWYLLKLADMLVRGAEEQPPKVTIHLPPTPVTEVPPSLPVGKLKAQSRPSIKIDSSAPVRSPVTPYATTPKLKLLSGGSFVAGPSVAIPTPKRSGSIMLPKAPKPAPPPLKSQKPNSKHVPRARTGGMELSDLHACRNMLKKLQMNKHATLFLQPVDPIRDKAPNYFDVIKNPMDLTTLGAKLEAGKYPNKSAFENDFRLMINNCKQYNMDGTYAFNEALALEAFFDKQWERIKKTLENVAQRQAVAKPIPKMEMPPPTQPATAARASVKLKLGGTRAGSSERGDSPVPSTSKALKLKRPKSAVDLPPPPYVDDGSHDLLQEVIAIEEEQNNKRPSSSLVKLNVGKRKRPSNVKEVEDDILKLANPSKRDKSVSSPSQTPVVQPPRPKITVDTRDGPIQPKPRPKLVLPPKGDVKSREENIVATTAAPSITSAPVANTPSAPRITIKGKEKEKEGTPRPPPPPTTEHSGGVPLPAPTPKPKKAVASTIEASVPINEKKCKVILNALYKMPESGIFAVPVDPVRDGCPTYYDEIKNPMDLGTIQTKLSNGRYATMEDFANDTRLVFKNCRQFNPPGTYPVICADKVEQAFDKEWAKANEKKLSWQEKRSLIAILNKLVADPISWVFREPVDPVALGIPTYYEIIPKKDARDLRTIKRKLDEDRYESLSVLRADFELMIRNAITFNGAESEVGQMAHTLFARFKDALASSSALAASLNASAGSSGQKKRKEGDRGTPQPMPMPKKLKLV